MILELNWKIWPYACSIIPLQLQYEQIVLALEGKMPLEELNDGIMPGHSSVYSSCGSSEYNYSLQYREDVKKFRKLALESVDIGSSEYSEQTSDYGPNKSSSSTEDRQTTQEMEPPKGEKDTNLTSQSSWQQLSLSGKSHFYCSSPFFLLFLQH